MDSSCTHSLCSGTAAPLKGSMHQELSFILIEQGRHSTASGTPASTSGHPHSAAAFGSQTCVPGRFDIRFYTYNRDLAPNMHA